MRTRFRYLLISGLLLALLTGCAPGSPGEAGGQSETTGIATSDLLQSPVEIICPWAAGGSSDQNIRQIAAILEQAIGQPVNVSNRTGAGGAIGFAAQRDAAPDGCALGIVTAELNTLSAQGAIPFSYRDLHPIIRMNTLPACIAVSSDSPFETLDDFLAYAGNHPGGLRNGHVGTGSIWHICAARLELATGTQLSHTAYDGAATAVTALRDGQLDVVVLETSVCHPFVATGEIRILGVMAEERLTAFPEYPTCKELGYDIVAGSYQGIVCPAGVPDNLKTEWERILTDIYFSETYQEFCEQYGLEKSYLNSAAFGTFLEEDLENVSEIIDMLALAP